MKILYFIFLFTCVFFNSQTVYDLRLQANPDYEEYCKINADFKTFPIKLAIDDRPIILSYNSSLRDKILFDRIIKVLNSNVTGLITKEIIFDDDDNLVINRKIEIDNPFYVKHQEQGKIYFDLEIKIKNSTYIIVIDNIVLSYKAKFGWIGNRLLYIKQFNETSDDCYLKNINYFQYNEGIMNLNFKLITLNNKVD